MSVFLYKSNKLTVLRNFGEYLTFFLKYPQRSELKL